MTGRIYSKFSSVSGQISLNTHFCIHSSLDAGSPFTNPTGTIPAPNARSFKVRDHALNLLFETPFTLGNWHNFAVQVDWNNLTLAVLYSTDGAPLKAVTKLVSNPTAVAGAAGQGDFHFTVLKVCTPS